ncbi:MAG: hypothetical protein KGI38_03870 [Thaumarchaeota archaeon]|nr:hypothetical protein [Nitrososphaerota archaeon]
MTAEGAAATRRFHWVEGRYSRTDSTVFTRRFYLPAEQRCPVTAEDDAGVAGSLIEGSCIEVNRECFIATAALGSELDPRVRLLRSFRDDVLLQSDLRAPFSRVLASYYRFSPPIAAAMKRHRAAKFLLKWTLVYPAILFARGFVAALRSAHRE